MSRSLDPAGAEDALIRAALDGDDARADEIPERVPEVRRDSLACALLVADPKAADRLNSASANTAVDPTGWPPLLLQLSLSHRRCGGRRRAPGPGEQAAGTGRRSERRDP